jgi:hypothetical protein
VRWWKVLGVAAFVGVAATGVAIARAERRRRAYTPEEIRARLHARLTEASGTSPSDPIPDPGWRRLRRDHFPTYPQA